MSHQNSKDLYNPLVATDELLTEPITERSVSVGGVAWDELVVTPTSRSVFQFLTDYTRYVPTTSARVTVVVTNTMNNGKAAFHICRPVQKNDLTFAGHLIACLSLLRGELEVLYDFSDKLIEFPIQGVFDFLSVCLSWPSDKFVAFTKYHTACPMAALLKNDLPPNPSNEHFPSKSSFWIWTGPWLRFLKNRVNSCRSGKNRALFWSYLQGIKRATAVVDESFILKSLVDHAEILSTPPPSRDFETLDQYPDLLFNLTQCLPDFVRRFDDKGQNKGIIGTSRLGEAREVSNSASFEMKRSNGGARNLIRQTLAADQGIPIPGLSLTVKFEKPDKKSGPRAPRLKDDDDQAAIDVSPLFAEILSIEPLYSMVEVAPGRVVSVYSRAPWYRSAAQLARHTETLKNKENSQPYVGKAAVSSVLEPIKVRLITKSHTFDQAYSKQLQKLYWSYLKTIPAFVLTSRPMVTTDLNDLLAREEKVSSKFFDGFNLFQHFEEKGSMWVSGDYKAATDGLNLNLTKWINEELMRQSHLPSEFHDIARTVLYEQDIYYPKNVTPLLAKQLKERGVPFSIEDGRVVIRQVNGQLMGSILSFPILCIANLLTYWSALNKYLEEMYMEPVTDPMNLPVLVNGDDILFRANPRLYEIWLDELEVPGFKLSVGKNYIHRDIFTINSQCFLAKSGSTPNEFAFSETHYLNVGLLIGEGSVRRVENEKPVDEIYNLVTSRAQNPRRAHRRFLHYHRKQIEDLTTGPNGRTGFYNLFVPKNLYGLGFRAPSEVIPSYTFKQSLLAQMRRDEILKVVGTPVTGSAREVRRLVEKTTYKSDLAPPTYPQRHHFQSTVTFASPTEDPPPGWSFEQKSLTAPPLFEESPANTVETSLKIVHPRKNTIRRFTRLLAFRKKTYVPTFVETPEDSFVPIYHTSVVDPTSVEDYALGDLIDVRDGPLTEEEVQAREDRELREWLNSWD